MATSCVNKTDQQNDQQMDALNDGFLYVSGYKTHKFHFISLIYLRYDLT